MVKLVEYSDSSEDELADFDDEEEQEFRESRQWKARFRDEGEDSRTIRSTRSSRSDSSSLYCDSPSSAVSSGNIMQTPPQTPNGSMGDASSSTSSPVVKETFMVEKHVKKDPTSGARTVKVSTSYQVVTEKTTGANSASASTATSTGTTAASSPSSGAASDSNISTSSCSDNVTSIPTASTTFAFGQRSGSNDLSSSSVEINSVQNADNLRSAFDENVFRRKVRQRDIKMRSDMVGNTGGKITHSQQQPVFAFGVTSPVNSTKSDVQTEHFSDGGASPMDLEEDDGDEKSALPHIVTSASVVSPSKNVGYTTPASQFKTSFAQSAFNEMKDRWSQWDKPDIGSSFSTDEARKSDVLPGSSLFPTKKTRMRSQRHSPFRRQRLVTSPTKPLGGRVSWPIGNGTMPAESSKTTSDSSESSHTQPTASHFSAFTFGSGSTTPLEFGSTTFGGSSFTFGKAKNSPGDDTDMQSVSSEDGTTAFPNGIGVSRNGTESVSVGSQSNLTDPNSKSEFGDITTMREIKPRNFSSRDGDATGFGGSTSAAESTISSNSTAKKLNSFSSTIFGFGLQSDADQKEPLFSPTATQSNASTARGFGNMSNHDKASTTRDCFSPGLMDRSHERTPAAAGRRRKLNTTAQVKAPSFGDATFSNPPTAQFELRGYQAKKSLFQSPPQDSAMAGITTPDCGERSTGNQENNDANASGNVFKFGFSTPSIHTTPSAATKSASFTFGSTSTNSTSSTKMTTNVFGWSPSEPLRTPAKPSPTTGGQFSFGMKTPVAPFQFGNQDGNPPSSTGPKVDRLKSTFGDFHIGSAGANADEPARISSKSRARRKLNSITKGSTNPSTAHAQSDPKLSPTVPFQFGNDGSTTSTTASKQPGKFTFGSTPSVNPFFTSASAKSNVHTPEAFTFGTVSGGAGGKEQKPKFSFGIDSNSKTTSFGFHRNAKELSFASVDRREDKSSRRQSSYVFKAPGMSLKHGISSIPNTSTQQAATTSVFGQSSTAQSNFNIGSNPPVAPQRRILRAARPRETSPYRQDGAKTVSESESSEVDDDEKMNGDKEDDDRDWAELKRLGGIAYADRNYRDAAECYRLSIEVLESLIEQYPEFRTEEVMKDKAKLHSNRAASLMMLMQISDAQRECRSSIEVDPSYTRAYLRLCRIQILLGDIVHAKQNIAKAKHLLIESNNKDADPTDLASIQKMEASIEKLSKLQGEIKWSIDALALKKALMHLEEALIIAPSSRQLQVQKVQVLLQQKNYLQITRYCRDLVNKQETIHGKNQNGSKGNVSEKSKPEREISFIGVELGLYWAMALHYQNKVEDATELLSTLEHLAPCSSKVIQLKRQWHDLKDLKHKANEQFKRNEFQRAIQIYSQALEVDPQHDEYCAVIYCNRAAALMGLERYHTALLDCEEALQRKPKYPRALLRRARCFVALKKYPQAIEDFTQYLKEQPRDSSSGSVADIEKERQQAKAAMEKELKDLKNRAEATRRAEQERQQNRKSQQQNRHYAWDDNTFFKDYRSNGTSRSQPKSNPDSQQRSKSFAHSKHQARTHYEVLGVAKTASSDDIKKAYRKLALTYHPDKAKSTSDSELFKEMTAAYNVLSDTTTRTAYDRELLYSSFDKYYRR